MRRGFKPDELENYLATDQRNVLLIRNDPDGPPEEIWQRLEALLRVNPIEVLWFDGMYLKYFVPQQFVKKKSSLYEPIPCKEFNGVVSCDVADALNNILNDWRISIGLEPRSHRCEKCCWSIGGHFV